MIAQGRRWREETREHCHWAHVNMGLFWAVGTATWTMTIVWLAQASGTADKDSLAAVSTSRSRVRTLWTHCANTRGYMRACVCRWPLQVDGSALTAGCEVCCDVFWSHSVTPSRTVQCRFFGGGTHGNQYTKQRLLETRWLSSLADVWYTCWVPGGSRGKPMDNWATLWLAKSPHIYIHLMGANSPHMGQSLVKGIHSSFFDSAISLKQW